ncbi:MAG: hypothetical protein ACE5GT_05075 [Rhodospirillales bacterium]
MGTRLDFRSRRGLPAWYSLLVLPVCFVAAAVWTRAAGGPFWLWHQLDPDYFYLLDALNVLNLTTPGHVYHPGTTVEWLGALALRLADPFAGAETIAGRVLAEPEAYLRLIGNVFIGFNALALAVLGAAALRAFGTPAPAWLLQTAPFVSMLMLKNSYHVKPEALLLATALTLAALALLTLEPGLLGRRRRAFAVAFGAIAGFGVATKVTALPVFLLPLFVLGGVSAIALYGAAALAALVLFTLPAAGAYDVFFSWMATVAQGSGAYGGGGEGLVNWALYPGAVIKLFKRPAFHVVFVLSVLTLAWALWRRRQGSPLPGAEVRLLAGVVAAQLAHVLLVAKQPSAIYLIPSLVLIPLALVLVWRLGTVLAVERGLPKAPGRALATVLAVLVVAGGLGATRLTGELAEKRQAGLALDNDRFAACARVHAYASSSRSFALLLGDYVTGSRFGPRLAGLHPANDYWLEHWWDQSRLVFRGWRGPEDMAQTLGRYPCAVLRVSHWARIKELLPETLPGLAFDARCSTAYETILVRGAGCDGRLRR